MCNTCATIPARRWKYDTTVQCYEGQHGIMTWVLGIPGLVFVALACPLWMAWFLGRNHHRLGDPAFLARCAGIKRAVRK